MEDEHDELRFVCKLCDKKYPSGKSLGGHMRSHVIAAAAATAANSSESDEKFSSLLIDGNGMDNGNPSAYGLRENPRKTWRAVGSTIGSSTFAFPNEKICKQCGKGFQSLKALCGHMACHSEKDRNFKDYDHSWTSENLEQDDKLIIDSHSDTEEPEFQDPTRVTRSKTKRYKKVVIKPYSLNVALTNNDSNNSNYNYGSSSVSETDELDQEEVAMCLMMLSKDSANWAGVNSVVESSDNNSAVLETKSSSVERISKKSSGGLDADSVQFENLTARKVESDISVEELLRYGDPHKKSKRVLDKTQELTYEQKLEIRRNLFREFAYLKKRVRDDDDSYTPELEREGPNKKRNKYECLNCNKVFTSFQGLGGHRPCHKKNNTVGSKHDSGENSLEGDFAHTRKAKYDKKTKVKKIKGHECPICFRMFKSGQALGGHKRSHFINGSMDHYAAMGHAAPSCSDMIDLNLPAPEEDQD
ncbi:putative transcription factor C2H2 family [Helianthus debilis subsp. tardiflorus]